MTCAAQRNDAGEYPFRRQGNRSGDREGVRGAFQELSSVPHRFWLVSARTLDWTSTEECLRRPWQQYHEVELPTALVKRKVGFAAFEAGVSGLSILDEYEMTWPWATGSVGPEYRCGVNRLRDHAQLQNGSDPVVMGVEADDAKPVRVVGSAEAVHKFMAPGTVDGLR